MNSEMRVIPLGFLDIVKPLDWETIFNPLPSGKRLQFAMENHHLLIGKSTISMGHVQKLC